MDMSAQTLIEHFLADILAFLIDKHPVGKLAVPTQAMTTKFDTVLTAEISNAVCISPIELAFARLQ